MRAKNWIGGVEIRFGVRLAESLGKAFGQEVSDLRWSGNPLLTKLHYQKIEVKSHETIVADRLHLPTAHLLFHFWVLILIENFLLSKQITLFLVWEPLFTRNSTLYVSANLSLIYWPTYSMYLFLYVAFRFFRSTINEESYQ